ncbi:MAG: beta-lactamase family protein [Bacteroidales bacterium]|nr:beta-lactamase family protein [Bacteroidales bacterium]
MMKPVMVHLFILLSLNIYTSAVAQTKPQKIDALISAYHDADCFNGVVLVSQKGEVIYRKAFGLADRELNVPMTTEMRFRIASISKPFTAMIILQLVDEGILALDGKITDYIPDYKGMKGDSITIEQLLTHTSGILENLDPEKEAIQERLHHSLRDMVRYAEESDLYFEPGTGFHYSNLAYNMLAYIAESVTYKTFDELLTDRIFQPLEMVDTKQCHAADLEKNLAKGYEYKLVGGYENAAYFDPSYTVGPGGLISNVDDLRKFDKALYSRRLVSEKLFSKMRMPTNRGSYGYGWELGKKTVRNRPDTIHIMSHAGSINGFGSYMARIESDSILVIVLKNNRTDTYISPAFAPVIGQEIISLLYDEEVPIPKRSIARQMGFILGQSRMDEAIREYYRIRETDAEQYNFEESELNRLGIELLFRYKMPEQALKVFEINMLEFPRSYNTYDSYAYALMQKGDYTNSIAFYKAGLKILDEYPQQNNSESVLKDAENALKSIQEMELKIRLKLSLVQQDLQ